ncbi:MAG: hypothetical protein OXC07_06275 [Kistimonas sp.]|nr:hypothetical protein [Kistimonas sp.]
MTTSLAAPAALPLAGGRARVLVPGFCCASIDTHSQQMAGGG